MAAPVCGLRAIRALRCAVLNVPNPTNVIGCPFFNDLVIPSKNDSTAAVAFDFVIPVSCAIFAMRSCLFIDMPPGNKDSRTVGDEWYRRVARILVCPRYTRAIRGCQEILCNCEQALRGLLRDPRQRGVENRVGIRRRRH